MDDLSDELKEWLSRRERLRKLCDAFRDAGDHIMLRSDVYDPDALEEPLRSEEISYLSKKQTYNKSAD